MQLRSQSVLSGPLRDELTKQTLNWSKRFVFKGNHPSSQVPRARQQLQEGTQSLVLPSIGPQAQILQNDMTSMRSVFGSNSKLANSSTYAQSVATLKPQWG